MMVPLKVSRSTIAAQSRVTVKVFVQPAHQLRVFSDQPQTAARYPESGMAAALAMIVSRSPAARRRRGHVQVRR
jgi:hypothetical protein